MGALLMFGVPSIIGWVLFVISFPKVTSYYRNRTGKDDPDWNWMLYPGLVVGLVFLLIVVIFFSIQFNGSRNELKRLQTVSTNNIQNYKITADRTEALLTGEMFLGDTGQFIAGSVEKFEVAHDAAQSFAVLRQEINRYNLRLARYRYRESNWWYWGLWKKAPEDLKPLVLEAR